MECKLNDPPRGHMHGNRLPDKDQISVIFGSQKDQ